MPKIAPARPDAHPTHPESAASVAGVGWCLPCYDAGSFTLSVDPDGSTCLLHEALSAPQSAVGAPGTPTPQSATITPQRGSPRPRGCAARRPAPSGRPRPRPRTARWAADRQLAPARAYGRRRAAARLTAGNYAPHPGWRHLIAPGWRVLLDQAEALAVVEGLVDAQDWRADKRAAWTAILRQLVYAMDWDTGLVAALTADRLGAAGGRAARTVSRVIAWARDIGLVVVVEHAASAEFLGTDHGRTPTYALVTNTPLPQPPTAGPTTGPAESGQLTLPVDESGDPPASSVENKPLNGRRLEPTTPAETDWLLWRVPETAPDRTAAARRLLGRLSLDRGGVPAVPLWRTRALLRPWWDAGACPAALLWAIDHHPDRPDHHRGDALRGAADPLRVLGYRLRPWHGRLGQLPSEVIGIRGDYVTAQHQLVARVSFAATDAARRPRTTAQLTAQAALRTHLAQLRARRDGRAASYPPM